MKFPLCRVASGGSNPITSYRDRKNGFRLTFFLILLKKIVLNEKFAEKPTNK
jgi:hypothetical protein